MMFLSGFDGLGVYRQETATSNVAPVRPAIINQIRPAPQAQIRPATQAMIRPAPEAMIRSAPQAQILPPTYQADVNQAYANMRSFDSVFGEKIAASGLGEDGTPIWRTMSESQPITPPTATLPAFRVPGAGMQAKGPLGPQPIPPGPSGKIKTYEEQAAQNPDAALLQAMRNHITPLLQVLAQVPPSERKQVFQNAMNALEFPAAPAAVEELTMRFIAQGTNGQIAFKEALARVLATNLKIATKIVADTRALRRAPSGLYGLHGLGIDDGDDADVEIDDFDGLSGVWKKIKSGVKSVAKWTGKVTKVVGKVTGAVACGAAGATQDPKALAACGAAKAMQKAGSGLESATKGKKKKGGKAEPAPKAAAPKAAAPVMAAAAPSIPAPAPDLSTPAPESAPAPEAAAEKPAMSMGMKIGIGVGAVAVVGGLVYFASKK